MGNVKAIHTEQGTSDGVDANQCNWASDLEEYETEPCRSFAEHFSELQKKTGKLLPPRSAFESKDAKRLLSYLTVLEFKEPKTHTIRLSGTVVVERASRNTLGRNLLEVSPLEQSEETWAFCRQLALKPCGDLSKVIEKYDDLTIPIEILTFPFVDAHGNSSFLISPSAELNQDDLLLKGDRSMRVGRVSDRRFIDIGADTAHMP